MVPMGLFRKRTFAVTNAVSFFMYFGTFGSIFLLTQVLQHVHGLHAVPGRRPDAAVDRGDAGRRADRRRSSPSASGRAASWRAGSRCRPARWRGSPPTSGTTRRTSASRRSPFVMAGAGMGLVFAPSASALLQRRRPAPGRAGVGHEQRDPRGRRRLRRRRAGDGVQRARRASPRRRPSSTASSRRCGSAAAVVAVGAVVALVLPAPRAQASAADEAVARAVVG